MLGFSLAHGSGVILFFFPLLLFVCVVVVAPWTIRNLCKRRSTSNQMWAMLGLAIFVFAFMELPYGFWQLLFVNRLISSPSVGEFLSYAAADGDLATVKALVSHGVSVDSANHEGKTGLHAAAGSGQMKVLQFLASRGANLNALDRYGDSPLEVAASEGRIRLCCSSRVEVHKGFEETTHIAREEIQRMH